MSTLVLESPAIHRPREIARETRSVSQPPGLLPVASAWTVFTQRTWSAVASQLNARMQALHDGFIEAHQLADGGERVAPSVQALEDAETLIRTLPPGMALPHPLFEASGAVALEWDIGTEGLFVLAFDGTGYVEYSVQLGARDTHFGREPFRGHFPPIALQLYPFRRK